jgi:hypothetical protein
VLVAVGALESPRVLMRRQPKGDVLLPLPSAAAPRVVPDSRRRALLASLGIGTLITVLGAQTFASAVVTFNNATAGPVFPAYFLAFGDLATRVPVGASVYMYNEGDSVAIKKQIAAALFLPDRNVSLASMAAIPMPSGCTLPSRTTCTRTPSRFSPPSR